jgi:biopolymer transport protein ExbD
MRALSVALLTALLSTTRAQEKSEPPQRPPAEMDARSRELIEKWNAMYYRLGRKGVKTASVRIAATVLEMGNQDTGTGTYRWSEGKSTSHWSPPEIGASLGDWSRQRLDEWFKTSDPARVYAGAKLSATEKEDGSFEIAVTGKGVVLTGMLFGKDGVLRSTTRVMKVALGEMRTKDTFHYERIGDLYAVSSITTEAKLEGVGTFVGKTTLTRETVGPYRVTSRVESVVDVLGSRTTLVFSDWRLGDGKTTFAGADDPKQPNGLVQNLAQIGTVGNLPPPRQTLRIELDADGALFVRSKEMTFEALRKELPVFARREPEPHVVIRADRTLPWFAVQWVMAACVEAGLYRVYHAAKSEEKGAPDGALALYLPKRPAEGGIGPVEAEPDVDPSFELRVASRNVTTSREAVHASLVGKLKALSEEERSKVYVEFHATAETPTGHCLRLLDAILRAGIGRINVYSLDEAAPTTKSLKRRVADLRARRKARKDRRGFGVSIDREAVPEPKERPALTPLKRVRGRFAGFFPSDGSGFDGLVDIPDEEELGK